MGIENWNLIWYNFDMWERNLDLNNILFHGLEPYHTMKREQRALEKLESVFQCGAILSRSGQLSQLDLDTHEFMKRYFDNKFMLNWNGSEYISICTKTSKVKVGDSGAYNTYVAGNNAISIALSEKIMDVVDNSRLNLMDGELQVKNSIPLDEYMVGVICGGKSFKELNGEVEWGRKICATEQELKDYLPHTLEWNQDNIVDSVGNLLCKYGYDNIPIISSRDGFEIVKFQDAIGELGL